MKIIKLFALALTSSLFVACGEEATEQTNEDVQEEVSYAFFGDTITPDNALTSAQMLEKYKSLNEGDTIPVKFIGEIQQVCQTKGCWMSVQLSEEKDAVVRFKDYGFFMPFNAAESETIVNGIAFLDVTSVEKLRERAEEEGLSEEEIAEITEPKVSYRFEADGVLIKE